jgi:hypothetical protein
MNFPSLLAIFSLTPAALLLIVGWFCRQLISTRLKASVAHEFNVKIETVRIETAERVELIKTDLRAREAEVSSLRAGALAAMQNNRDSLNKRRLEAVDQMWLAVAALQSAKIATKAMQSIKYKEAAAHTARDVRARDVFKLFAIPPDKYKTSWDDAFKAQPYVTPMAWALYSAYQSIVSMAVMQLHILSNGLGDHDVLDDESIIKLVKTALPHQAINLDKHGAGFVYYVLDELEGRLLAELRSTLEGSESNKEAVKQASQILAEVSVVQGNVEKESRLQTAKKEVY